ncbi:undecaprenyldiphospho-muramoylpentapeptide beta-N-acetylglucosaminyltransferase [Thermohalobacter berrensis]|uniref:UDP-N-acetylglucosamine--N-acetylmuramyl-(pentapeptide) pyrophosphoryl-undecaprenol N-acetylglucosamine transferase n=1 Tax=Thermohalobacter berrensis TaxID=99594 RepID=A0A419T9Z0_9FIRM|nr:undecaprenyldiphospho-muramoylpentapeptide beta-N-acetylglucosaminyltransferase [Thermohalobacter berrensis]RKD34299.1 undecaprenyldiphospho-muramoylpentapeptide beta-N-acetylglucosaminyltransferase [Thermohalobacter berrensis]
MKVLVTGGGTGGHIYPALSIARRIEKEFKNPEILYVGTKKGLEAELVPKEGYNFQTIRVKGFMRKLSFDTLMSLKELALGLNDARKIINKFNPDIVIGTGGYVCGPVVLVAALKKIPTLIHEQNAYPGVTNKILSRFVDKVAASFEESIKYFHDPSKVVITGNPVRENIITVDKKQAYKKLNINDKKPFILSFGGSGGQRKLNDAMLEVITKNVDSKNIQILHVTGKRHYEDFIKKLSEKGIEKIDNSNIKIVPYLFEMPMGLAAADLVITSAGAITLAEVTTIGVPTILIPKAYTAENHQEHNARALEKKGASVVILEKELSGSKLNKMIKELLSDRKRLKKMSVNSKSLGKTDVTNQIVKVVKELLSHA